MVQMVLIAFAQTKKWGIGAVALASMGNMAFPAISSIKANNVQHFEQVEHLFYKLVQKVHVSCGIQVGPASMSMINVETLHALAFAALHARCNVTYLIPTHSSDLMCGNHGRGQCKVPCMVHGHLHRAQDQ